MLPSELPDIHPDRIITFDTEMIVSTSWDSGRKGTGRGTKEIALAAGRKDTARTDLTRRARSHVGSVTWNAVGDTRTQGTPVIGKLLLTPTASSAHAAGKQSLGSL